MDKAEIKQLIADEEDFLLLTTNANASIARCNDMYRLYQNNKEIDHPLLLTNTNTEMKLILDLELIFKIKGFNHLDVKVTKEVIKDDIFHHQVSFHYDVLDEETAEELKKEWQDVLMLDELNINKFIATFGFDK